MGHQQHRTAPGARWHLSQAPKICTSNAAVARACRPPKRIVLVGCWHSSLQSEEHVRRTIRALNPDAVMLELDIGTLEEMRALDKAKSQGVDLLLGALLFLLCWYASPTNCTLLLAVSHVIAGVW